MSTRVLVAYGLMKQFEKRGVDPGLLGVDVWEGTVDGEYVGIISAASVAYARNEKVG